MEALAATCLVAANVGAYVAWSDLARLGVLLLLAAVFAEAVDRIETLRQYLVAPGGVYVNSTSVWLIAGVVALPPHLAVVVPLVLAGHTLIRNRSTRAGQAHRVVYTGASDVLSCLTAALLFEMVAPASGNLAGAGAVAVAVAIAAYWVLNAVFVGAIVVSSSPVRDLRAVFGSADEELGEVATLCLGALLGVTLTFAPILAPLTLVLMVTLRRSALVQRLQEQATFDARTGLLNAGAWRLEADREVSRAARTGGDVSLLMIDLDHFKHLNDTHGHPAGDHALKAVADCLSDTLRGYDAVGRYGGEEFVALLVDADELTGEAVAERVCARIRAIGLPDDVRVTASIGVATSPAAGADLDALVSQADAALYAAKHAGRDRVGTAASCAAAKAADALG